MINKILQGTGGPLQTTTSTDAYILYEPSSILLPEALAATRVLQAKKTMRMATYYDIKSGTTICTSMARTIDTNKTKRAPYIKYYRLCSTLSMRESNGREERKETYK